jgi:hypothetical protein
MKFLKWIKQSFEGKDGKAASRKLTAFSGWSMICITWFCDLFYNLAISELLMIIIGSSTLVAIGLFTAQNIVDILKRPQNSYYDNDIYNPYNRNTGSGDDAPVE